MTYDEALCYIHSAPKFSKELGNRALKKILDEFDNPQDDLKCVHIAGTNGKGSIASMLNAMLFGAGIKTGLFTSPYIEVFNERIQVNSDIISDDELAYYTDKVKECMEKNNTFLSEFALILVIAFLYFKDKNCEIVVLETGLGGRLDATNVINKSELSIITKIGLDHMQYLGDTKEKITIEKCGIIKEHSTVLIYPEQEKNVIDIIQKFCAEKNSRLIIPKLLDKENEALIYDDIKIYPSLKGEYQRGNVSVAVSAAKQLGLKKEEIKFGTEHTFWPGRFEFVTDNILLDGCHNGDGARAFAESTKKIEKSITIVTCAMEDKDISEIACELSKVTKSIIVTEIDMPRCTKAEVYANEFKKYGIEPKIIKNPFEAIDTALKESDICAVCGSLYLIGEVRKSITKGLNE